MSTAQDHLARARRAESTLTRARAKLGDAADENAQLKEALEACKAGDSKKAASIIEALLGTAPAATDDDEGQQPEPDENSPAAAKARIGQHIAFAQGTLMGGGPTPLEAPRFRSRGDGR